MVRALGAVPVTGGATANGVAPEAENVWGVVVHLDSGGNGGGGVPDNGGVHLTTTEHGHTVHCYAITARPV